MLLHTVYACVLLPGLSTLAMCAPSDKFLYMGGPLAMGLGVVFVSSIGLYEKYMNLFFFCTAVIYF